MSIAQQKYTASKKYDPRCSSVVIALLPWLVPEGKVKVEGGPGALAQHKVLASSPPALYPATLPGNLNYADAANAAVQCSPQYYYKYLKPRHTV